MQGEAPPEVKAAIEAKRRATAMANNPVGNADRVQAVTAPSAAAVRLGRPTIGEAAAVNRKKSGSGGLTAILIVLVLLIGGAGAVVWLFVLGPVTVRVTSTPDGVEVVRGDQVLGTTPAKLRLPRGNEGVLLAFRKDGFVPAQRQVELTGDQELKVRLLPKPEEEPEPPPCRRRSRARRWWRRSQPSRRSLR